MKQLLSSVILSILLLSCEMRPPYYETPSEGVQGEHIDLWLQVQGTTSTGTYVAAVNDPENSNQTVDIEGKGAEADGKMRYSARQKGSYYYDVNQSTDGFAKYQIVNNTINTIAETPFGRNSYSISQGAMKAATVWIDDSTLILLRDDVINPNTGVLWTKLNTETMKIIDEGKIELNIDPTAAKFASVGHLAYRPSDNRLLYFTTIYNSNYDKDGLVVLTINPDDMSLVASTRSHIVHGLAYESFGNSFEDKCYTDSNGDVYVSAQKKGHPSSEMGVYVTTLVRVKNAETSIDEAYGAVSPASDSDILITKYLKPNKALLYIRDSGRSADVGNSGSSFNAYYALFDSEAKSITPIQYNGEDLPWSSGKFANRICQLGDLIYFGLNTAQGDSYGTDDGDVSYIQAQVYIYNTQTDAVEKGFSINAQYEFFRMHAIE